MVLKKHENSPAELNQPYEENEIGLKGIIGFTIGLFLLIIITFALMRVFLNTLTEYNNENAGPVNPLIMSEKERLPPEPRLQLAPGFGVETEKGFVNLELREPQAEYRELRKQWEDDWKFGKKDKQTGTVTMMPIDEAKAKLLSENVKAKAGADAEKMLRSSQMYFSDSSAGRALSDKRR